MKNLLFVAAFVAAIATDATAQRRYEYSNDRNRDSRNTRERYSSDSRSDDFDRRHAREYNRRDYNNRDFDRRDRWENNYAPNNWEQIANRKINDGEDRGLITRFEAHRLNRELDRINECEARYRSNGYFTRRERARIADDIHDLFDNIRAQTHDDDVVFGFWNRRY